MRKYFAKPMYAVIRNNIYSFLSLVRYWQWNEKLQTFGISALLLLTLNGFVVTDSFLSDTVSISGFMIFLFGYAYVLNSHVDKSDDVRVQKNYLLHYSDRYVKSVIIGFGFGALALPAIFFDANVFACAIFLFILTTGYSAPPMRFKERSWLGIFVAGFTQRAPFLFYVLLQPDVRYVVLLFVWQLFFSLIIELNHQIGDYANDIQTQTVTFVTQNSFVIVRGFVFVLIVGLLFSIGLIYMVVKTNAAILVMVVVLFYSYEVINQASHALHMRQLYKLPEPLSVSVKKRTC